MRSLAATLVWILSSIYLAYKHIGNQQSLARTAAQQLKQNCNIANYTKSQSHIPNQNLKFAKKLNLVWCGVPGAAHAEWQSVLEALNDGELVSYVDSVGDKSIGDSSRLTFLLTVRSPEERIASAWLESPIEPPGFETQNLRPEFSSLLRYILNNFKNSLLHPRLRDIYTSCNLCNFDYDIIWKHESGAFGANKILNELELTDKKHLFGSKMVSANSFETEKMFSSVPPKVWRMIRRKFERDNFLFNY